MKHVYAHIIFHGAHIVPIYDHVGVVKFVGVITESLSIVC